MRSNYYSQHIFERMINSLSDKETKGNFEKLEEQLQYLVT